jgi:hypothetical protein
MSDNDQDINLEAEDPALEHEGDVKEPESKETIKFEPDLTTMPDGEGKEPNDGADVVRKLMEDRGLIEGKEPEGEEIGDIIPDEFVQAALTQGWTDEQIVEFAENLSDEQLVAEASKLLEEDDVAEPGEDSAKHEGEPQLPQGDKEPDESSDKVAALEAKIANLEERLGKFGELSDERAAEATLAVVNKMLDDAGGEFEVFGKTESLMRYPAGPKKGQIVPSDPAFKARSEVYNKASVFIQAGLPVHEAMQVALDWYKGAHLEADVHKKVVKDLKRHEKKLSAKRSGKETVPSYEDEEERKAAVVRDAARRAGVKGVDEWN